MFIALKINKEVFFISPSECNHTVKLGIHLLQALEYRSQKEGEHGEERERRKMRKDYFPLAF